MFPCGVMLLLLHQGYTLVPVITVLPGEPAALTCVIPDHELDSNEIHWYKQRAGDSLKIVVTQRRHANSTYGSDFSASRMQSNKEERISTLNILQTVHEDEGMYHCAIINWAENVWQATYLAVKGHNNRTMNYTITQKLSVSDPSRDTVNLECSVLSDSENRMCSGNLSVFWFRATSDKSHPDIIYTDGNSYDDCHKNDDTRCYYRFSKDVRYFDEGTYYCAVATCGQVIFGKGSKLDKTGFRLESFNTQTLPFLLHAVFVVNITITAVLVCSVNKNKCIHCKDGLELQKPSRSHKSLQRGAEGWIYSVAVFTTIRSENKNEEKLKIYAVAEALGFN